MEVEKYFTKRMYFLKDVLSSVTYPQGGSAAITYVKSAQSGNADLPDSLLVVSTIITNDGLGTTVEKDYSFGGGKQYTTLGVRNRKFAGFALRILSMIAMNGSSRGRTGGFVRT